MLNGQTRGQTAHDNSPGNGAVVQDQVVAVTAATTTHIGFSHRHFRRIARMLWLWLDSVIMVVIVVAYLGTFSASTISASTLIAGTAYAQDAALFLLSLVVMVVLGVLHPEKPVALHCIPVVFSSPGCYRIHSPQDQTQAFSLNGRSIYNAFLFIGRMAEAFSQFSLDQGLG